MYTLVLEAWDQVKSLKPGFLSRSPHFSFITVHYFWIIGLTILGSILLYPCKNIAYIDALFFASGAATQSGLNTVNLNVLNTYQQIVVFIIPMMANPITINTFVVFLRLFWFEKRFQHIAREAKRNRRSISKSRSQMKHEHERRGSRDLDREEKGVNGRSIVVMHNAPRTQALANDGTLYERRPSPTRSSQEETVTPSQDAEEHKKDSSSDSDSISRRAEPLPHSVTFADRVHRSDDVDEPLRLPIRRTTEDHIAFLEAQRNPKDKEVLRIPNPREADMGKVPEALDEDEAHKNSLTRQESAPRPPPRESRELPGQQMTDDNTFTRRRNINFVEPRRDSHESGLVDDALAAAQTTMGIFRLRIPRRFKRHLDAVDASHFRTYPLGAIRTALSRDKDETTPYLSWQPTVGRNSAFVDLTEDQREELGGVEYRSLKSLALILVLYFWVFQIIGIIGLLPWIMKSSTYGPVVEDAGAGRVWWSFFTSSSSFTDLGFTLTPDSMISFESAIWPLLLMSFLIIVGNTGFPIMLRFLIWITSLCIPAESSLWEELRFLLDHPRRCFTLLFPSKATWWLFWVLVLLNGTDLLFYIILDLGNSVVTHLPANIRVLDGWFQAVSTRTAGFAVVNLADLHPGIQVSYLIMMYISVLPIAISVRRTNVYEERSLGIYSNGDEDEEEGEPSYVGAHLRRQLSFDLWFIFLGLFIIAIADGSKIESGDPNFTLWQVLFEVVSAYGTVGLSLGYPTNDMSFSAEFSVISKLVIIAMQIRGRHRGLPYELDRAILLPSESLQNKENMERVARMHRRNSVTTANTQDEALSTGAEDLRTVTRHRTNHSVFSNLLHPGPLIPAPRHSSYRSDAGFDRTMTSATSRSRHSMANVPTVDERPSTGPG